MRKVMSVSLLFLAAMLAASPAASSALAPLDGPSKGQGKGAMVDLKSFVPNGSIGVGVGLHYGGLGADFEFQGIPYVAAVLGLGDTEGMFMAVGGVRFYIPLVKNFAGRISLLGGAVAIKEEKWYSFADGTTTRKSPMGGGAAGIGSVLHITDNFFICSDIYYINAGEYRSEGQVKKAEAVTYAVGLGWTFYSGKPGKTGKVPGLR